MWKFRIVSIILSSVVLCSNCCSQSSGNVQTPAIQSGKDPTGNPAGVNLQETEDDLLLNVDDVAVSPDGAHIALADASSGKVFLFNAANGSLVRVYKGTADLIDTVAERVPYDLIKAKYTPGPHYRMIRRDELLDNDGKASFTDEYFNSVTPSSIVRAFFIDNDELWMLGALNGMYEQTDDRARRRSFGSFGITALLRSRIHDSSVTINFADPTQDPPWPTEDFLAIDPKDSSLILFYGDYEATGQGQFDSTFILASYSTSWVRRSKVLPMPRELRTVGLGYRFLEVHATVDPGTRQVFAVCNTVPRIYNLHSDSTIPLPGIPASNDVFFATARDASVPADSLLNILGYTIEGISMTPRATFMVWGNIDNKQQGVDLLQIRGHPRRDVYSRRR